LRRAGKTAGNYGKELFLCVLFDAKKSGERERTRQRQKSLSTEEELFGAAGAFPKSFIRERGAGI
jgi:hypothetical protein